MRRRCSHTGAETRSSSGGAGGPGRRAGTRPATRRQRARLHDGRRTADRALRRPRAADPRRPRPAGVVDRFRGGHGVRGGRPLLGAGRPAGGPTRVAPRPGHRHLGEHGVAARHRPADPKSARVAAVPRRRRVGQRADPAGREPGARAGSPGGSARSRVRLQAGCHPCRHRARWLRRPHRRRDDGMAARVRRRCRARVRDARPAGGDEPRRGRPAPACVVHHPAVPVADHGRGRPGQHRGERDGGLSGGVRHRRRLASRPGRAVPRAGQHVRHGQPDRHRLDQRPDGIRLAGSGRLADARRVPRLRIAGVPGRSRPARHRRRAELRRRLG